MSDDWNAAAVPWKAVVKLIGQADLLLGLLESRRPRRRARRPARVLNEIVVAGNWPKWVIKQRPGVLLEMHDGRKRHLPVAGRRRGRQVDHRQPVDRALQRGIDLQDHAVLVRLGVDGRDDALAECVVERIVDRRRGDAEAGGGSAVDDDVERQPLLLQIAGDVAELRQLSEALRSGAAPRC